MMRRGAVSSPGGPAKPVCGGARLGAVWTAETGRPCLRPRRYASLHFSEASAQRTDIAHRALPRTWERMGCGGGKR